jgi:hypothetical protein
MGKYNIFIDADDSMEIIDDNIPARDEREALEYYKSKNVEKFNPVFATTPNLVYFKNPSSLFTITTFPLCISNLPLFSLIGAPCLVPTKSA